MSESSDNEDRKLPAVSEVDSKFKKSMKKKRTGAHNRKTSMKQKKLINHERSWIEYCKFMNANLEKKKHCHESPHIVVHKSLHLIIENCIILNNSSISEDNSLLQKIYYDIEMVGRKLFILIDLKKVRDISSFIHIVD